MLIKETIAGMQIYLIFSTMIGIGMTKLYSIFKKQLLEEIP